MFCQTVVTQKGAGCGTWMCTAGPAPWCDLLCLAHNLPALTLLQNDTYINIVNSTNIMLSQVLLDSLIHPLDLLAIGFEVNFY